MTRTRTALVGQLELDSMFADALQFAIDFKQPIIANRGDLVMLQHRQNLLNEELTEYVAADWNSDLVEVADAAVDILYIALGTLVALGERPEISYGYASDHEGVGFAASLEQRLDSLGRGQSLIVWAIAEGRSCAAAVDAHLMGASNLPAPVRPTDLALVYPR